MHPRNNTVPSDFFAPSEGASARSSFEGVFHIPTGCNAMSCPHSRQAGPCSQCLGAIAARVETRGRDVFVDGLYARESDAEATPGGARMAESRARGANSKRRKSDWR